MSTILIAVLILVVIGVVTYIALLLLDKIPMDGTFKQIANALIILAAVICAVVYVLLPLLTMIPKLG